MSLDIITLNTGLPTENSYTTVNDSSGSDGDLQSAKAGYVETDPGTKPYIDKSDEAAKYGRSLNPTKNLKNTYDFAKYLFVKSTEVGTNGIANAQVMQQNYQKQGAASVFFTVA